MTIQLHDNENKLFMKRIQATNLPKDTMLIVPETHSAFLIKDGEIMETLNSGRYSVFAKNERKTENISVEVVYFSKSVKMVVKWGANPQFEYMDPELDLPVHIGARGVFEVQLSEPRKAYKVLIGLNEQFDVETIKDRLRARMQEQVKYAISDIMKEKNYQYEQINYYEKEIKEAILEKLIPMFENDYGMKIFSFTFEELFIDRNDAQALRDERKRREVENRQAEKDKDEKKEQKEQESLEWERTKYLLGLRQSDYEKYLEVCKLIGWKPEPRATGLNPSGRFCRNCGTPYGTDDKFCPECGAPVGNIKKICPKCGREYLSTVKFCSECGEKL